MGSFQSFPTCQSSLSPYLINPSTRSPISPCRASHDVFTIQTFIKHPSLYQSCRAVPYREHSFESLVRRVVSQLSTPSTMVLYDAFDSITEPERPQSTANFLRVARTRRARTVILVSLGIFLVLLLTWRTSPSVGLIDFLSI